MDEQEQSQIAALPSSSFAEEGMLGLGHVGLQADGGNGGVKAELKERRSANTDSRSH